MIKPDTPRRALRSRTGNRPLAVRPCSIQAIQPRLPGTTAIHRKTNHERVSTCRSPFLEPWSMPEQAGSPFP